MRKKKQKPVIVMEKKSHFEKYKSVYIGLGFLIIVGLIALSSIDFNNVQKFNPASQPQETQQPQVQDNNSSIQEKINFDPLVNLFISFVPVIFIGLSLYMIIKSIINLRSIEVEL